jgi:outer membrane lipoprotein-sorting protein
MKLSSRSPGPFDQIRPLIDPAGLSRLSFARAGQTKVGDTACLVYKGKASPASPKSEMTLYLRASDQLPVAYEFSFGSSGAKAEVKGLQVNPKMTDSLFEIPPGYRIQDNTSR